MDRHIIAPPEGLALLQEFLFDPSSVMPEDVRAKLRELIKPGSVAVAAAVEAAELIYARREELPAALLEIGAQLAAMCASWNFYGLGNEGRGFHMAMTIRSMDAVASEPPVTVITPPAPNPDYAAPPPLPGLIPIEVSGAAPVIEGVMSLFEVAPKS